VGAHLNDLVAAKLVIVHHVSILVVLTSNVVHVEFLVNLRDHQIKDWDDVRRVVLDLPVKHLIELEHMVAVNVKDVSIKLAHISQFLNVVWCFLELLVIFIVVIILYLLKVVDEVFEFHLDLICVDVGSPEDLRVRAGLIGACHLVGVEHTCGGRLVIG